MYVCMCVCVYVLIKRHVQERKQMEKELDNETFRNGNIRSLKQPEREINEIGMVGN